MNLNELYKNKSGVEFWKFLGEWKYASFSKQQKVEINKILESLMENVGYNFDIIYNRLVANGDKFYDKEEARMLPTDDVESRILTVTNLVKGVGHLPLSLRMFYKVVGGVDFMKKFSCKTSYPIFDILADPVVIPYLSDDFIEYIKHHFDPETWDPEDREEVFAEKELPLSPDSYHKENYSGGEPYSIILSQNIVIDNYFPFEGFEYDSNNLFGIETSNTTFIEYLRNSFKWGGFPGIEQVLKKYNQDKRLLEFVNYLKEGLIEI